QGLIMHFMVIFRTKNLAAFPALARLLSPPQGNGGHLIHLPGRRMNGRAAIWPVSIQKGQTDIAPVSDEVNHFSIWPKLVKRGNAPQGLQRHGADEALASGRGAEIQQAIKKNSERNQRAVRNEISDLFRIDWKVSKSVLPNPFEEQL